MATATANLDNYRGTGVPGNHGWLIPWKDASGATAAFSYTGTLVITTAGYGFTGADTASSEFGGVLVEPVAVGDLTARVRRKGVYAFDMTGGSAASDLGKEVEVKTNSEVGLAGDTTNHVKCGRIIGWDTVDGIWTSGAKCLVCIDGY